MRACLGALMHTSLLGTTWALGRAVELDQPTNRPRRACANCARQFQPTSQRRMLCARCYRGGTQLECYGFVTQRKNPHPAG